MSKTTKEKILFNTKELFLNNGIEETYISNILEKSKVSNGTFFYYFESKNKIILDIYQQIKDESEDHFYNTSMDSMDFETFMLNYWRKNIDWILKNPKEYNYIKVCNRYNIIKEKYKVNKSTKAFLAKIQEAINNCEITLSDSDLLFKNFIGIRDSLISYILENPKTEQEIEEISDDLFNRFLVFIKK